jgi:DNA-binding Lrp family transcriptional regulator
LDASLSVTPPPNNIRLEPLDEQILWELSRDARTPNNTLAERLNVSASTTLTRLRRLRDARIYQSSHAQVHYPSLGLPIQAIVFVRLRAQARGDIRGYAHAAIMEPAVLNIFYLGGPDDLLIHVAATSTDQLRDFVAKRLSMNPAVASTQTQIVFDHLLGPQHMSHVAGYEQMRLPIT